MNQAEKNRIHCLKNAIFMVLCLLAFTVVANRDSGKDSFRAYTFTSEDQQISSQAILTSATDGVTTIHLITTPYNKSRLCANKLAFDNRIFNQHFITLQKSRETIIPSRGFIYYLIIHLANPDDLPDLS